jgi:hypothetical protein
MARIPDADIERLKQEVSLQRLVEAQGIELKRHGADLLGLCPFHDDHEPSLQVSPKKNLWHCLGACQKGGSVIDWVMRSRGVSFRHAVGLRDLRRRVYIKAKAEPEKRFWGLYVHVCKLETLQEAYRIAKENDGAPGSDGVTFAAIEESGVDRFLDEIRNELVEFRYLPLAVRKKEIPMPPEGVRSRERLVRRVQSSVLGT